MKNLDLRLKLASVAIVVWLAADFGMAAGGVLTIAGLGGTGATWSQEALQALDRYVMTAGIIFMLAYLGSVILVARWIYRASENAHTLSDEMTISPGWAIGWYFVPIASLFKPFQAMREIWQTSMSPHDPNNAAVPSMLQMWWGLWIVTNVLGNISFRLALNAKTASDFVFGAWLDIASFAVDVPLGVLLMLILRQVTAHQRSIVNVAIFE